MILGFLPDVYRGKMNFVGYTFLLLGMGWNVKRMLQKLKVPWNGSQIFLENMRICIQIVQKQLSMRIMERYTNDDFIEYNAEKKCIVLSKSKVIWFILNTFLGEACSFFSWWWKVCNMRPRCHHMCLEGDR